MSNELDILKRRLERETLARKRAEKILEEKSLELYTSNQKLSQLNKDLQTKVQEGIRQQFLKEEEYKQLIENASDIIYKADKTGNFSFVNKTTLHRLGYDEAELIGKNYTELIPESYVDSVRQFYLDCIQNKEKRSYYEFPIRTKAGEIIWLGQNVQIHFTSDEDFYVDAVARDISDRKAAQEQLLKTQKRLSTLIQNLQSAVLLEDENRNIALVNKKFYAFFNIPSNETLLGTSCNNTAGGFKHHFVEEEQFVKRVNELIEKKEVATDEILILKDGRTFSRDFIPIFEDEKYLGSLWQFKDISDKKNAELQIALSEEKYRSIIENMELGLLEVDNNGLIVRAYDTFCKQVGYTAEELIGKDPQKLFLANPNDGELIDKQQSERFQKKTGVYEVQMLTKDKSKLWVLISGAPIINRYGEVEGSLGIHFDITQRKKMEDELAKAKEKAELGRKAEQAFLANMSHEIRTPLNAVIGMVHLLLDTNPSDEQLHYLKSLQHASQILQGLINDILDISKIEAGKLEYTESEIDLHSLIHSLQRTFELKIESKLITVESKVDEKINTLVKSDYILLNQILFNLLGNAEKFTEEGKIGLTARAIEKNHDYYLIEFSVYDTGIGINHDRLTNVFDKFTQANSETSIKYGGTGLGLAITKKIVEFLNGNIKIESEPNKGTTITITLKLSNTNESLNNQKTAISKHLNLEGKQINDILIAEDNQMNINYLNSMLSSYNLNYEFALNGKEAVAKAREKAYDLILMDFQMPEMNGIDATIEIRSTHNLNTETPIIALTAAALVNDKEKAFTVGMDDFLSKPFTPEQLLQKMLLFGNISKKGEETITKENTDNKADSIYPSELDVEYLYDFYEDDYSYFNMMLELFAESTPTEIIDLQKAIEQKNLLEAYTICHRIKPTFPMVGITAISPLLEEFEQNAKDDNSNAYKIYPKLKEALNLWLSKIEKIRKDQG